MPVNIRNLRLYLFSKNCERVKHRVDLNRYITQPETVINNKKKALVNPHQENAKPATYPSSREFTIEIAPIAFMRGRTLEDCYIILDEAQNSTPLQMKMFLTRLGVNSKAIITGDITQIDLPRRSDSGLIDVLKVLKGVDGIGFAQLNENDVVRHKLVRDIIKAYDKANGK